MDIPFISPIVQSRFSTRSFPHLSNQLWVLYFIWLRNVAWKGVTWTYLAFCIGGWCSWMHDTHCFSSPPFTFLSPPFPSLPLLSGRVLLQTTLSQRTILTNDEGDLRESFTLLHHLMAYCNHITPHTHVTDIQRGISWMEMGRVDQEGQSKCRMDYWAKRCERVWWGIAYL